MRKFTPNLAGSIALQVALTKKEAAKEVAKRWRPKHDQAYATVKQLRTKAPVLHFRDFQKTLRYTLMLQDQAKVHSSPSRKAIDLVIIAHFSRGVNDS